MNKLCLNKIATQINITTYNLTKSSLFINLDIFSIFSFINQTQILQILKQYNQLNNKTIKSNFCYFIEKNRNPNNNLNIKYDILTKFNLSESHDEQNTKLSSLSFVSSFFNSLSNQKTNNNDTNIQSINKLSINSSNQNTSVQNSTKTKQILINDVISVNELSHKISVKGSIVISKLMSIGIMATLNQFLDFDTASILASEFNFETKKVGLSEDHYFKKNTLTKQNLIPRPPIVSIMGHVDHGKTTILDYIRKSNIRIKEKGGITQTIGAYFINTKYGDLTLLDTPGHKAFHAMRDRGAELADIAILVIAADDGVMPQTIEAIKYIKNSNTVMFIAVNKSDIVPDALDKITNQLALQEIYTEKSGGDVQILPISASTGLNMSELLEGIMLQAEMLELTTDSDSAATGYIIDARLDKGKGPLATILIKSGTLSKGDFIISGNTYGKIRCIFDSEEKKIDISTASYPVTIQGFSEIPQAGNIFNIVKNEKDAKAIINNRKLKQKQNDSSNSTILQKNITQSIQNYNVILKTDISGSYEALKSEILNLSNEDIQFNVIHASVGEINENDIVLAETTNSSIIGFNIKVQQKITLLGQSKNIKIYLFSIIYDAIDSIKAIAINLLAPKKEEAYIGKAEIRKLIPIGKTRHIAGCSVLDGKIIRSGIIKVLRSDKLIYKGSISSLKRFKQDVIEVASGYECGIEFNNFSDLQEEDIVECYYIKTIKAKITYDSNQ